MFAGPRLPRTGSFPGVGSDDPEGSRSNRSCPMSDLAQLTARIADHFHGAFGRTPLAERVQDILAQATTLGRFADLDHLKDETGDLLCSVLQLCTECGWDPAAL